MRTFPGETLKGALARARPRGGGRHRNSIRFGFGADTASDGAAI
jgi:hypothetical protein